MYQVLVSFGFLYFALSNASGQIVVSSGTNMVIDSGTTINILSPFQTFVVSNGASVLNNGEVYLGESTMISEANGSAIIGNGTEQITQTITGQMMNEDPGGLGCEMSTNISVGTITVIRGHTAYQNDLTDLSVTRWFQVQSLVNGGLDLELRFHYDNAELNGNTENTLEVNLSTNNGASWQIFSSTVDIANDLVAALSIDSLALFTLFAPGVNTYIQGEPIHGQEMLLYPIPSNDKVWVRPVPDFGKVEHLVILDQNGRIIIEKNLANSKKNTFSIQVHALAQGFYSVLLFSNKGIASAKMVIEK